MKERPILFSAPMVRALLAGTKTQTRRLVKPELHLWEGESEDDCEIITQADSGFGEALMRLGRCPYGVPGDRLWVKETHQVLREWATPSGGISFSRKRPAGAVRSVAYRAGPFPFGSSDPMSGITSTGSCVRVREWRPSIFMPRWASRIDLEVTAVRVERLQDISEADAVAEGVEVHMTPEEWHSTRPSGGHREAIYFTKPPSPAVVAELELDEVTHYPARPLMTARRGYERLWESINGAGSWAANPWVWVLTFKRVRP